METLEVLWDWLIAIALTLWIGLLVVEGFVLNGKKQPSALLIQARKHAQPLQWLCLSVLLVAEVFILLIKAAQLAQSLSGNVSGPAALGQLLAQSAYGFIWIAREVLIVGSLGLLWWRTWATGQQRRPFTIVSLALAGLILITYALSVDSVFAPPTMRSGPTPPPGPSPDLLSTQTQQVGNLSVTLTVSPGKIDVANTITVRITDTHSGQFVTSAHIVISTNMELMDMGTVRATMMGGTPTYRATFAQDITFSMTGTWDITLSIQLPNQLHDTVVFRVWLSG
jgi:hypothetical protein